MKSRRTRPAVAPRAKGNRRAASSDALIAELDRLLPLLVKALPDKDPGDLMLILERMLRKPGSNRRFFIFPNEGGGFAF